MDRLTQLQPIVDAQGRLHGVIGYRDGAVWYGTLTSGGMERDKNKLLWEELEPVMKR